MPKTAAPDNITDIKSSGLKATLPRMKVLEGEHHDHLVCLHCGRVVEFFDAEIERRQGEIAKANGFDLQGHELALYGVCSKPECQRGKSNAVTPEER